MATEKLIDAQTVLQIAAADSFGQLLDVLTRLAQAELDRPCRSALWVGHAAPLHAYPEATTAQTDTETEQAAALPGLECEQRYVEGQRAFFPIWCSGGEPQGVWELRFEERPGDAALDRLEVYVPFAALACRNLSKYMQLEEVIEQDLLTSVERELAIQLILDNMRDGLLVSNRDGTLSEVRSRAVETWFGAPGPEQQVWDYLAGGDAPETYRQHLQGAFEQLFDDVLPFALCADQLPPQLHRDGRVYRLSYQRVDKDGEFTQVAISIRDVTQQLEAERGEAAQRELVGILTGMLKNRDGFALFLEEMHRLIAATACERQPKSLLRLVHTLKGNSAIYGFRSFSALCHSVEDRLNADESTPALVEQLDTAWTAELSRIAAFVEDSGINNDIVIAPQELDELISKLNDESVRCFVRRWCHPTFARCLDPATRAAARLAARQGKELEVQITGGSERLPSLNLQAFLSSLVHVFRNAVDHGIEPKPLRLERGKPAVAQIAVRVEIGCQRVIIEVEDDGRGIDWEKVREHAAKRGLPCDSEAVLSEAIFGDGITTAETVTAISGRGVGLSAVRAECLRLGGTYEVRSRLGRGTAFRFEFAHAAALGVAAFECRDATVLSR